MEEHVYLTERDVAEIEQSMIKWDPDAQIWHRERRLIADWREAQAELTRLRGIEAAIRKCPTTILQHTGIETLIYTTELRDALEAE